MCFRKDTIRYEFDSFFIVGIPLLAIAFSLFPRLGSGYPAQRNNETDVRWGLLAYASFSNKKLRSCLQFERLGGFLFLFLLPMFSWLSRKIATFGFGTRDPKLESSNVNSIYAATKKTIQ